MIEPLVANTEDVENRARLLGAVGITMKRLLAGVCLALLATNSWATGVFYVGNDLVKPMREWEAANEKSAAADYSSAARFTGYVTGVYDSISSFDLVCGTTQVTTAQVTAIVAKFLKQNPERWNEPAVGLVAEALAKAFPCPAK